MPADKKHHINYTREAFKNPVNLGAMFAGALVAVIISGLGGEAGVIMTAVFGAELVYLGIVPKLPGFRKKVETKIAKEHQSANNEKNIFNTLDAASQRKFLTLKKYAALIQENLDKTPDTTKGLTDNLVKKVNELVSNYLNQLELVSRYSIYLNSALESNLREEVVKLINEVKATDSQQLKQTKTRRIAILQKRLQKFKKAREKFLISETQIETIEDAVRYIYEQTLTFSKPEDIDFQLDNLLWEADETAKIITDLDSEFIAGSDAEDEILLDFDAILEEISTDEEQITLSGKKLKE